MEETEEYDYCAEMTWGVFKVYVFFCIKTLLNKRIESTGERKGTERIHIQRVVVPVTAINFKSGSHAHQQFHGEMGHFSVEGMVHDFQKKGVFSGYNLHGF